MSNEEIVHLVIYYVIATYLWWGVFTTISRTKVVYRHLKDEWRAWDNIYAVSLILLWPYDAYLDRKDRKSHE